MKKNIWTLWLALVMGMSVTACGSSKAVDLEDTMKAMDTSIKAAIKSDNMDDFAKNVKSLREQVHIAAAVKAGKDADKAKAYQEGMQKLETELAGLDELIAKKDIDAGRAFLQEKIKPIKQTYHEKLGVDGK